MGKLAREKYRSRLVLPECSTDEGVEFYTNDRTLVAIGYNRVVIGDRGPYIEFSDGHIVKDGFGVPPDEAWRLKSQVAYYCEYRSKDESYVKLYYQRRTVGYADYLLGLYYMSPFDLTSDVYPILIGDGDESSGDG